MRVNFEYDMHLQYENRALKARIKELENAVRQLRQNREHWFQVYGDMEKEHKKVVERKQGEIRRLQKLCKKTAIAYEQMHEKYLEQLHLRYAAESALEEEKGKNQKLRAQLNRDYENSSIPSSKSLRPKKVANIREKTGRKPGDLIKIQLRDGTQYSCTGVVDFLQPILDEYLNDYPEVPILLRGDSGFATPVLYKQCEENGTSYVIRLKENGILREKASYLVNELDEITRNNKVDYAVVYGGFMYKASSWAYERRVVSKVEKPENQMVYMFVTNMDSSPPI